MKKRVFYPGEEWLYIRLYTGPDTAEAWLVEVLPVILQVLEDKSLIKKCFFLRYLDPLFHLRIRIELSQKDYFGPVVQLINELSSELSEDEMIWKTEIGTYEREYERYGADWIEKVEEIFSIDSKFWLVILPELRGDPEGENKRWMGALLGAERIFNDFSLPLKSRIDLLKKMVETLEAEIGGGKKLRIQIDEKFRESRVHLEGIMKQTDLINISGFSEALNRRTSEMNNIIQPDNTIEFYDEKLLHNRISDIIHMSLNRCLRSKHRMQELVIYSFLKQLYISRDAREKATVNQK